MLKIHIYLRPINFVSYIFKSSLITIGQKLIIYKLDIFYWFASLKELFSRTFPSFLRPAGSMTSENLLEQGAPLGRRLQEAMNAQIRALTKGDITKEREVLSMDTWRALAELDAQAKEYEELKKQYGK